MKKILLASTLALFIITPCLADEIQTSKTAIKTTPTTKQEIKKPQTQKDFNKQNPNRQDFAKKRAEFDNRLNLSEEQKQKAKELREQGRKNIEPLMQSAKEKRERIEQIKNSSLTEAQKQEIQKIQTELHELHKQMHEQRMKNMKDFESILNENQLKELQKIKEEGRKNFQKNHDGKGPKGNFEGKRPMPPAKKTK